MSEYTLAELQQWPSNEGIEAPISAIDGVFRSIASHVLHRRSPIGAIDEVFRKILSHVLSRPTSVEDNLAEDFVEVVAAAAPDAMVLAGFESLGDNCEFAIVQRACGVQAPSLLAFARTSPDMLADILQSRFEGIDDPCALRLANRKVEHGIERILVNDRLGIVFHIADYDYARKDDGELLELESKRLRTLADALITKLTAGSHIFVVKCNEDLTDDEAQLILEQMASYGSSALLYVVKADKDNEQGSVVAVGPNLYRGYIQNFAPYHDAYNSSAETWIAICRNTLRMRDAQLQGTA